MGFAVTNAQRDGGRQREKETPSSSDDAFAAYFGAGFDYGSDYGNAAFGADAFGDSADEGFDAFGDLNFGSYDYGNDAAAVDVAAVEESVAADEAEAANRPSNNDADDGKTILPGVTTNANDRTNSAFDGWCWTNSGATKAAWAKTSAGTGQGKWIQCLGSGSACEVKVARKISDNSIVQITSQCANEVSCVANMKQNFNPGTTSSAGANTIYSKYVQQACKPFGAAVIGNRFKSNSERSTCFFCTEPCSTAESGNSYSSSANCVGPSADGTADGAPANAVDSASVAIDIFDDATLAQTPSPTNKFTTDNYYTTVTGTLSGSPSSITISKIQAVQLATDGVIFTPSG